jgi:tetratricopeptide (TPR) repeat protein
MACLGILVVGLVAAGCGIETESGDDGSRQVSAERGEVGQQNQTAARINGAPADQTPAALTGQERVASAGDTTSTDTGADEGTASAEPALSAVRAADEGAGPSAWQGPVSFAVAESLYFAKRYAEAAAAFTAYTTEHPQNAWGFYMLGLSCWKGGKLEEAAIALNASLVLDSSHFKSYINLARVQLADDRPGGALITARRAVAMAPDTAVAHRILARAYHNLDRAEEAIAAYKQAITLDDRDVWALNGLGLIRIEQGRHSDALAPLARAAWLRDDHAVFANNLGVALEGSGHYSAAARAYRSALAIDSTYAKAAVSLDRVEGLHDAPGYVPLDLEALAQELAHEPTGPELSELAN